jgi:hypothetical protein
MYRVDWLQTALDQLAEIWMSADAEMRQIITAASHQIDQELRVDPFRDSESRAEGRRVRFVAPLGLLFRVDGLVVSALRVWLFRKRKANWGAPLARSASTMIAAADYFAARSLSGQHDGYR